MQQSFPPASCKSKVHVVTILFLQAKYTMRAIVVLAVAVAVAEAICPLKVTVTNEAKGRARGEGRAYVEHPELYQDYFAEPKFMHEKIQYTSKDGMYAIWFDKAYEKWMIGSEDYR